MDITNFLKKTGTKVRFTRIDHRPDGLMEDMCNNNHYKVKIYRKGKCMTVYFTDNYYNTKQGKRPTPYDVLTCLEKRAYYTDIWDFANTFGYEITDKETYNKVNRIYKACVRQTKQCERVFGDVMDMLEEIA